MGKELAGRGILMSRSERKGTVGGGFLVFKKEEYRTCLYDDDNDLVEEAKGNMIKVLIN